MNVVRSLGKHWLYILAIMVVIAVVGALVARCAPQGSSVSSPSSSASSSLPSASAPSASGGASVGVAPWERPQSYDSGEGLPRLNAVSPLPRTNDWKVFGAAIATGLYSRVWQDLSYEDAQRLVTSSCLSNKHDLGVKARELCEQAALSFTGDRQVFADRQASGTHTSVTVTGMQVEDLRSVLAPYGSWFDDVLDAGLGKGMGAFTVVGTMSETRDGVTTVSPFRLGVICWYQTPDGRWDDFEARYGRGIPDDAWLEIVGLFAGGF